MRVSGWPCLLVTVLGRTFLYPDHRVLTSSLPPSVEEGLLEREGELQFLETDGEEGKDDLERSEALAALSGLVLGLDMVDQEALSEEKIIEYDLYTVYS